MNAVNEQEQDSTDATDGNDGSGKFRKVPGSADELSEKQRLAVEFLASGLKYAEIARALAIDPRTLFKWRQQEAFKEAVAQRRQELWGRASDRLRSLLDPSIDVMEQHLKDRYDRSRFRAASLILRIASLSKSIRMDDAKGAKS